MQGGNLKIKQKVFSKLFIAILYLYSQMLSAQQTQNNFVQSTHNSNMQTELYKDEVCPLVDDYRFSYLNGEQTRETVKIPDPACVARNRDRARNRAAANEGLARAQRMEVGNSDGLKKPEPPPKPDCGSPTATNAEGLGGYNPSYYACMSQYEAKMRDYNLQLEAYNKAVGAQADSQRNADAAKQAEWAKMNDKTASGAMEEVQAKNQKGNQIYVAMAGALAAYAAAKFAQSAVCSAQCGAAGGGCCSSAPRYMAAGIAFMLLNGKSNKQAGEHARSAGEACSTFNTLSSTQKDCSQTQSAPQITVGNIDPNTGMCKPDAPPSCQETLNQNGLKPVVTANGAKASGMTSAGFETFGKIQPDGSVKDKNGKIWKESDFKDKNAMIAAGIPASVASGLAEELYGANSPLKKPGMDPKEALKKLESSVSPVVSIDSGVGTNIIDINKNGPNGASTFSDKLNAVKNADGEQDRMPSSEGLMKEFNGELIGVSGDNIFLMMNRRYKLKTEQDTFLSGETK